MYDIEATGDIQVLESLLYVHKADLYLTRWHKLRFYTGEWRVHSISRLEIFRYSRKWWQEMRRTFNSSIMEYRYWSILGCWRWNLCTRAPSLTSLSLSHSLTHVCTHHITLTLIHTSSWSSDWSWLQGLNQCHFLIQLRVYQSSLADIWREFLQ